MNRTHQRFRDLEHAVKDFDQYSKWLVCVNNQKKLDCIIQNNDKFFFYFKYFKTYAEKVKYDTALQVLNVRCPISNIWRLAFL